MSSWESVLAPSMPLASPEPVLEALRRLREESGEGLRLVDAEGTVRATNPTLGRIIGVAAEELVARPFVEAYAPNVRDVMMETFRNRLARREIEPTFERQVALADGRTLWLSLTNLILDDVPAPGPGPHVLSLVRDVSARHKAEAVLNLAQAAVDASADEVLGVDPSGRLVLANRTACRQLGYRRDQLIGRPIGEVVPELDAATWRWWWTILKEHGRHAAEVQHQCRDGRLYPVEVRAYWVRSGSDDFACLYAHDITERKWAENERQAQEDRYRSLLDTLQEGIVSLNPDGSVFACNKGAERILGVSADEFKAQAAGGFGLPLGPAIHEDGTPLPHDEHPVTITSRTGRVCSGVVLGLQRELAPLVWLLVNTQPLFRDERTGRHSVLTSFTDITERKRVERKVRESEALYRAVVEDQTEMVCRTLDDGTLTFVNGAFCRELGREREDLIDGRTTLWDLLAADEREARRRHLRGLSADHPVATFEVRRLAPDGSIRWQLWTDRAVFDRHHQFVSYQSVGRDVTERKRAEFELIAARDAAETASRAKDSFLQAMSHEMLTPMNHVLGLTQLALDSEIDGETRQSLRQVGDAAESLLGIITDVLDFAQAESGTLTLQTEPIRLRPWLTAIARKHAVAAFEKGLELTCRIGPEVPEVVLGDPRGLERVLSNLLLNAIKFTTRGEIEVEVRATAGVETIDDPDAPAGAGVLLRMAVRDTGVGIPHEKQAEVFQPFVQVEAGARRRFGGTGLGLALSDKLAALMGGRIALVRSQPGAGSEFALTVPLAVVGTTGGESERPFERLAGVSVLVVDDHATSRAIVADLFASWRMTVRTASDATEALEALLDARRQGRPFGLAVIDERMPDFAGSALAERIRLDSRLDHVGLVGLHFETSPGLVTHDEAFAFDALACKPVLDAELADAMVHACGTVEDRRTRPRPLRTERPTEPWTLAPTAVSPPAAKVDPPPQTLDGVRILLVEDNVLNQKLAIRRLEKWGHRVTVVGDGQAAIDVLSAEDAVFDLVLMDVQMPVLDGVEAVVRIRRRETEHSAGHRLPIIAVTANAMKGDRERYLASGFDEYVSKPIDPKILYETIVRLTSPTRSADTRAREGTAAAIDTLRTAINGTVSIDGLHPSAGPAVPLMIESGELTVLDMAASIRRADDDEALFRELAALFVQESPRLIEALRDGVEARDSTGVLHAGRALRGAAGYFVAPQFAEVLARLEIGADRGDWESVRRTFTESESRLAILREILSNLKEHALTG